MKKFKRFASRTSIHGFSELSETRNIFWKFIWSAVVISAFGLTTFQIYSGIDQFLHQPLLTSVSRVVREEVRYPSISVCSPHWMYWVDWNKAYSMNFTKSMVLYALSYLKSLNSHARFNITETRKQLLLQMAKNNFTKLSQFYRAIARAFPIVPNRKFMGLQEAINSTIQFRNLGYNSLFLCHIISHEQVSIINNNRRTFFAFTLPILSYKRIYDEISEEEYNYNILQTLDFYSSYNINSIREPKNLTSFGLPWVIFPAGEFIWVEIGSDKSSYTFLISISGYRKQDTSCKKGLKSERQSIIDEEEKCKGMYCSKTCQCCNITDLVSINEDTFEKTCVNQIVFIDSIALNSSHSDQITESKCVDNQTAKLELDQCIENILMPCELWQYGFSQAESQLSLGFSSLLDKNYTQITILYPHPVEIIVTIENNVQTLESFIASVGGVLGIWTGASLLSCIQVLYLLCTPEYDK